MTPEEKFNQDVWWTLQAIKKELLSTPTGENVKINTTRLTNRDTNSPPTDDVSKCVRKLEELGAFKVVEKYDADSYDPYYEANPDWERVNVFELAINQPKFDELYEEYKNLNSVSKNKNTATQIIEKLSSINFLSICDVAMDIKEELQMISGNVVEIPVLRTIIRPAPFNLLFPADSIGTRDNYGEYRIKAIQYLKVNNYIKGFEISNASYGHRWEDKINVSVERENFDNFYNNLTNVYQKRVVEPNRKEEEKNKTEEKKEDELTVKKPEIVINELEIEGINIQRRSQESDAVYYDDPDHLDKVFRDYNLWRQQIKDFLIKSRITSNSTNFFFEVDSVPKMKGGIYGNIESQKSQELLKNIRIEISKKLEHLRNLKKTLSGKLNSNFPVNIKMQREVLKTSLEKSEEKARIKKEIIEELGLEKAISQQDSRPHCLVDGKWGYLRFGKSNKKIKIGGKDAQPFKLLQCLTNPSFGILKSIDAVFEAIREGLKYKSKIGVYDTSIDKPKKIQLIKNVIKELQKGNKLQGKIKFKWDDLQTKVWLEYLG